MQRMHLQMMIQMMTGTGYNLSTPVDNSVDNSYHVDAIDVLHLWITYPHLWITLWITLFILMSETTVPVDVWTVE
jgi:hypothetical protein